jgi:hypothetical protein
MFFDSFLLSRELCFTYYEDCFFYNEEHCRNVELT